MHLVSDLDFYATSFTYIIWNWIPDGLRLSFDPSSKFLSG